MPRTELQTTSFDPDELKKSFIDYLKTTNEFGDFDYEGSAINTIVDLLTYNTTYNAFLANMLANESFLDSAQLRESVVSHAQKLSYRPKSKTASRLFCNIEVKPSSYPESKVITMPKGLSFFKSIGNDTYTFTNSQRYTLTYDDSSELYKSGNVELIQGQFISDEVEYNGDPITIENGSIDMSTLMVSVIEGADSVSYSESTDIADIGNDRAVFFTRELPGPRFQISFGGDVIGNEPLVNSKVKIEYISCENIEGNKVESLIAGSSIDGYSNIKINVTQPSFGGSDRESIESIREIAPKFYQAQNRALSENDYAVILKNEYPYIRSTKVWGGEENNPPRYGVVFIVATLDGMELTGSLIDIMEGTLREKAVGSITPVIVKPNFLFVNMSIQYKMSRVGRNSNVNDVNANINEIVLKFIKTNFNIFDSYYNQSKLIANIINKVSEVESVIVHKTISKFINKTRLNNDTLFENLSNPIEPRSMTVTDSKTEKLIASDDGNGDILTPESDTLGTVNYETGEMTLLDKEVITDSLILKARPSKENVYALSNNVLDFGDLTIDKV